MARSIPLKMSMTSILKTHRTETWDGKTYPSLNRDIDVCDVILHFASVTNGELAYRSYQEMEEKTGVTLAHLAEKNRGVPHVLQGHSKSASAIHQQPDVVGPD